MAEDDGQRTRRIRGRRGGYRPELTKNGKKVRVKPMGRAARMHLARHVDDALTDLYNPESETQKFYHPSEDYAYMRYMPLSSNGHDLEPLGEHRFILPYKEANGTLNWHEKRVRTSAQLRALSQTPEWKRARYLEATGEWTRDPDPGRYKRFVEGDPRGLHQHAIDIQSGQLERITEARKRFRESNCFDFDTQTAQQGRSPMADINQEFVPITGGPYWRQLYLYAHWEQTSKAFEMRHHSEPAKATVDIVSDAVLGRGISWNIKSPAARKIWQEFWKRNDMGRRLRQMSDDFTWQGELLIHKSELPKGFVCIRSLDPGAFYEIVTDPADIETIFYYVLNTPTQYQLTGWDYKGQNLNIPSMQYITTQFAPSEIFHLKNNVSSSEKWGRSDFFAALSTLKRHRDWTNAVTLKDMLQANLIWKIRIHGDEGDVETFANDPLNVQLPAFGGTWVENEAMELIPLHEDVAGSTRMEGSTGQYLLSLFATSQNLPSTYFNISAGGTARATALTQSEPFVKKIGTRRQQICELLDHLYEYVMEIAVKAERIDPRIAAREEADPDWIFPAIFEEDRGARFRDFISARDRAVISHETMATNMAQDLGLEKYNYREEMDVIQEEQDTELMRTWPIDTEVAAQLGQSNIVDQEDDITDVVGDNEKVNGMDSRAKFKRQWSGRG